MKLEQFMDQLLEAAKKGGIETAEVYAVTGSKFRARTVNTKLDTYEVSDSCGLSLRGTVNGRMGYASTQALDEEAIRQLVEGVIESAELNEAEEQDEIYPGDKEYPVLPDPDCDLDSVNAAQKLQVCRDMDQAAMGADPRIRQIEGSMVSTSKGTLLMKNSYGLDLKSSEQMLVAYCFPVAKDGEATSTGVDVYCGTKFADLDAAAVGRKAAAQAISLLHAAPVPSGTYRVVLDRDAMSDLLGTFCGMFSAENAQQKLSLLAGKEGTKIASEVITLMDDPLLPGGPASCTFDAEGCATRTKAVIDHGVLTTLLHNRKTAARQGVQTTGNAGRAGYSGPVHVAPTNLFIRPGESTPEQLMAAVGNGLLITEVSGLHCGANPISGDFSLISKGFVLRDGRKAEPVERITVAGNFYRLLESIRAVANDLKFNGSSVVSPTVDAGELSVSGS